MEVVEVLKIIGIVSGPIALMLSVYTYFKHDKKIKQQQKQLNYYQLEKIEKEKEADKRAIIEAKVLKAGKDDKNLMVYNIGKCVARNVNVIFKESEKGISVFNNPCPIDIKPQNHIEIKLDVLLQVKSYKIEVVFEWEDDAKENNRERQVLQLL